MRIRKYTQEYWQELWSPDSLHWQRADRILFLVLPVIAFLAYLLLTKPSTQSWGDIMLNLVWIIPLVVWVVYFVLVVPYRLVSKYHNRHESILENLADVWVLGNKLKTEIYSRYGDVTAEEANTLQKQWMKSVSDIFMNNPHELGLTKLVILDVESKDIVEIPTHEGWNRKDPVAGCYLILTARLSKLKNIIQSLLDDGR